MTELAPHIACTVQASEEDLTASLTGMVEHEEFPCLGARSVFRRENATIHVYDELAGETATRALLQDLSAFAQTVDTAGGFASFVAIFRGPTEIDERAFERLLWTQLHLLNADDDSEWNDDVSSNPIDEHFAFSVAGTAFFVVGLHPGASRDARRTRLAHPGLQPARTVRGPPGERQVCATEGRHPGAGRGTPGHHQPHGQRPRQQLRGPPVLRPGRRERLGRPLRADAMTRLEPQTGVGLRLDAGQRLTVRDPNGGQVSDFFAVATDDPEEWFSSGRTIDYRGGIYVSTGDRLYSNRSRPMATIVEDTCGRHDILLTPCSQETFDLLYPELEGAAHPSCFANLSRGLAPFGVRPDQISTTFNIFMNVWTDRSGDLNIDPPTSVAGDHITLLAEIDLLVGLTACSAEKSNGGRCKPIDYDVLG